MLARVSPIALLLCSCVTFHEGALVDPPSAARFVEIGDTSVHYVDHNPNSKRAVVLLHGFGASLDEWREVAPRLAAAGYRVLALDLRGFGWSGRAEDADYSVAGQAELVRAFVTARGLDRFSVIGHSWGSAVALAVATQSPERVERVVLFNGMVFDEQRPTLFDWAQVPGLGELIFGLFYRERTDEKMALAFHDAERFVTQAAVERVEATQDRAGATAAALATIRAIDLTSLESLYTDLEHRTLILWGREDRITPLDYGERLANTIPRAELVVLPQCGHLPMIEWPEASSRRVLSFLEAE